MSQDAEPRLASVWRERVRIRAGETDPSRRATPLALCDILQEAAGNHAWTLGVALDQIVAEHRETWMLYRFALRLHDAPRWRDEITVETWPCGVERIYAVRDFCVRSDDGRTLAEASTTWLVVDLEGRRPSRDPRTPIDWSAGRPRALPDAFTRRLPTLTEATHTRAFEVRRSDLDLNGHVNHVRMLAWVLDALPDMRCDGARLTSLDAEFVAEALRGETVNSTCAPEGDGATWLHAVTRPSDGKLLLKARTGWSAQGAGL
jgi:medium-chain acyl-[acyl-carrier-protein] hydrolase